MNFSKVRRKEENWLAQIFRKDLIEREKTRNMNQNNAFCLPLIGFFTQSSQYIRFKKKICSYSMVHMMGVLNLCIFFYLGILSRFTVQQGKGQAINLTPLIYAAYQSTKSWNNPGDPSLLRLSKFGRTQQPHLNRTLAVPQKIRILKTLIKNEHS